MRIHITKATDPHEIRATLFLSLMNDASMLQMRYADYLMPSTPGLYKPGEIEPIFKSGVPYYTKHTAPHRDSPVFHPIQDMWSVTSSVYNEDFRELVSAHFMVHKQSNLSPVPNIPARSIKLIVSLLDYSIHQQLLHWAPSRSPHAVLEHFRPEIRSHVDIEDLLACIRHTWAQVVDWIGMDSWSYYTFVLKDSNLYINKCQDYRVIQWEADRMPPQEE